LRIEYFLKTKKQIKNIDFISNKKLRNLQKVPE